MLAEAGPAERIVIAEDSAELVPDHPHVISLQCRNTNIEGHGAVELPDLVRQALRMRPDRLVVGECRGAELREFLAAMNTGHDGAGGTIHASSAAAVPARLAAMGALAGMSREAVTLQAAGALDLVIHCERRAADRRISEIALLRAGRKGPLRVVGAVHRTGDGIGHGPGWQRLQELLNQELSGGEGPC
jgi:pilus assembly protein CpaF